MDRTYNLTLKSDNGISGLIQELLAPIAKANVIVVDLSWKKTHPDRVSSTTGHDLDLITTTHEEPVDPSDPIPLLWNLITSSVVCNTRRHPNNDLAWYQVFFRQLGLCSALNFEDPLSSKLCPRSAGILGSLLIVCLQHDFPPTTSVLESIILHFSGLSTTESWLRCKWEHINACIRLGPQTVLSLDDAGRQSKCLRLILDKVTSVNRSDPMATGSDVVLVSLLDIAIFDGEIEKFLHQWKDCLTTCLRETLRRTIMERPESPFEDDAFLDAVSSRLKPSVRPSAALKLSEELALALEHGTPTDDGTPDFYAALIIAECIIDGYNDRNAPELLKYVSSMYTNVARELTITRINIHLRWRLWRVLAKICKNWPETQLDQSIQIASMQLRPIAQIQVARNLYSQSSEPQSYEEALMAWRFLLAMLDCILIDTSKQHLYDYGIEEQDPVSVLLTQMTELMTPSGNDNTSLGGSVDDTQVTQHWHGTRFSIKHPRTLLLACAILAVVSVSSFEYTTDSR